MEIVIILVLLVLNGVFAMSEAAVIASRKARLQQRVDSGDLGAAAALKLVDEPNRFLSTVQIGITLIGILQGAFGGASIAGLIAPVFRETPLAEYADTIAFALVVIVITYLSLIIGELVPKRLALRSPEAVAAAVARPMLVLSRITSPVVKLLTVSTDAVLVLVGGRGEEEMPVTEEEIRAMMAQGVEAGVFEEAQHDMVEGIFKLGDRRISTLMTPRTEILWLDINDDEARNREKIRSSPFSRLPVCEDDLDHVVGMLQAKDLLGRLVAGESFDLRAAAVEPIYVPESMSASRVLDLFRENSKHMAFVIGEYGGLEGLVTVQDILVAIVGALEDEEPSAVQRPDGSWLLDGLMAIDEVKDRLKVNEMPGEHDDYETLGGFVMRQQGRIPSAGEAFEWDRFRFEVMDMDGNRVDKVLVSTISPPEDDGDAASDAGDGDRADSTKGTS